VVTPIGPNSVWTEEPVEPGVARVVDTRPSSVALAHDGTPWIGTNSVEGDGFTVEQLGADPLPTVHLMSLVDLDVAADGRVWAWTGDTLLTWGGDTWRRAECCEPGTRAVFPQDDGSALAVTLDPGGRLRAARPTIDGSIVNVVRHAVDGSSARGAGLELGPVTGDDLARRSQGLLSFASVGDGVVWAALPFGAGPEGAQLWRWEQGEWQALDLPEVDGEVRAMDITAGRDGSVWVYLADPRSGAQGTTWSATRRLARLLLFGAACYVFGLAAQERQAAEVLEAALVG
jgi:hypothetical protein